MHQKLTYRYIHFQQFSGGYTPGPPFFKGDGEGRGGRGKGEGRGRNGRGEKDNGPPSDNF